VNCRFESLCAIGIHVSAFLDMLPLVYRSGSEVAFLLRFTTGMDTGSSVLFNGRCIV